MFKWPGAPSAYASKHELADYAELICWRQGSTSSTALSRLLGRLGDNDYSGGVPEEETTDTDVEESYTEIEQRVMACRDGYPFKIMEPGYTLRANREGENYKHLIYKYLLLATRLNMKNNRVHADIDGALLLEDLSAEVAREYLGVRAESLVFGTAAGGTGFREKVDELCKQMKEGDGFVNRDGTPPREQDGRLDVVVWKHFTDSLPGKLIAFGQCKTGTDYRSTLTQLQPDSFCRKWLQSPLVITPVRMFFVSEALPRGHWYNVSSDAGLLFDRCRIVDFCDNISADILEKLRAWTAAASEATELPSP